MKGYYTRVGDVIIGKPIPAISRCSWSRVPWISSSSYPCCPGACAKPATGRWNTGKSEALRGTAPRWRRLCQRLR